MAISQKDQYSIRLNGASYSMLRRPGGWKLLLNNRPLGSARIDVTTGGRRKYLNVMIHAGLMAMHHAAGFIALFEAVAVRFQCSHVRIFPKAFFIGRRFFERMEVFMKNEGYRFCSFFTARYFEKKL